ncbi:MAG: hypothetical protein FWG66_13755 [Spirochaetes bacterium]|nr:hypothetical protein [Spirochaetota bacterium]
MNKRDFLFFLDFSIEWFECDLYSDELFAIQKENMLKNLSEQELKEKLLKGKYGEGSEHYRYGAFCWVIKNNSSTIALDSLVLAIEKEPDIMLKKTMLKTLSNK